ncbi:hypothetical protein BKA70DRAFT_1441369 [Coprinopsis sp. MPI-PUGE-AT-0042]|nr:hypothetical protein BKA70DRAFT_1441369 [Coprinopsis sp. MPI-PUGE-AT-0042]
MNGTPSSPGTISIQTTSSRQTLSLRSAWGTNMSDIRFKVGTLVVQDITTPGSLMPFMKGMSPAFMRPSSVGSKFSFCQHNHRLRYGACKQETMESVDSPIDVSFSNDLETWFPFIDGELTTVDDMFEVGRLGGFAQITMKPPSQEQLDSFHAPTNDELASYSLKKKRLTTALSRAAIRVKQLQDLCSQYEGFAQSIRSRLRPSTIKSKRFKTLVTQRFHIRPSSSTAHRFGMSREGLTNTLQVVAEKGVDGLSSDPGHLFSASRAIEKVAISLRKLIAQYERDSSQLEANIRLYTCAASITRLLPDELLLKIFSYLPGVEPKALAAIVDCIDFSTKPKVAAALTCRRWKHVVFNYSELWSSMRLNCQPFRCAKLKTLSTLIPSVRCHLARGQMCKRLEVHLLAWHHPYTLGLLDGKVPDLREQGKLLSPLLASSSARWSTLSIHANHLSTLVDLGLFKSQAFPNLAHLTIVGLTSRGEAWGSVQPFMWGSIKFPSLISVTLLGFLAGERGFPAPSLQPADVDVKVALKKIVTLDMRGPSARGSPQMCSTGNSAQVHPNPDSPASDDTCPPGKAQHWMPVYTRGTSEHHMPSLTDLKILATEKFGCKAFSCSADEEHLILPKDHATIIDFIGRSNCASTLQALTITHLAQPSLVLDLLPLLDNLRTLTILFLVPRWQSSLATTRGAWSNPTSLLLEALTFRVGTDGQQPTYNLVPHLQELSLTVEREPGGLRAYSARIHISVLEEFCRSRLKPPSNVLKPVLHYVRLRDQVTRHPHTSLVALRSWVKVNAPAHEFRVWFEDA